MTAGHIDKGPGAWIVDGHVIHLDEDQVAIFKPTLTPVKITQAQYEQYEQRLLDEVPATALGGTVKEGGATYRSLLHVNPFLPSELPEGWEIVT